MRLSAVLACLSACLVPAAAFNTNDDHQVPGNSPLLLCPGDRSQDTVTIEKVDLNPNPPASGQKLEIQAHGVVKKPITKGAYVKVMVKYGLIQLVDKKLDLCDHITNVDLKCPIERGKIKIEKSVDLPKQIPPGNYFVQADVYSADNKQLTCLNATVSFSILGNSFLGNEL